ncbi:MAG TPA: 16S rRNA (cytosine(1402)-N(4))-methyltransferase RsmH [Vicinamibacteria bacterium]|nr:16S rRNA (cytosine(1402)-N(4))-methyltransferase RsmH [Vicinamibacteria bacterium]
MSVALMTESEPSSAGHVPVLLAEAVDFLAPRDGGVYVDATFGGGGYSEAILRRSSPGGRVIALDRDRAALRRGDAMVAEHSGRLELVWGSFADLCPHLDGLGVASVDGIVADLGLSSLQLDDPGRGFSFSRDGALDMRFDRSRGPSAADLVNRSSESELADILYHYGEERRARAIAKRIAASRPIGTTRELRGAVVAVTGPKRHGIDPATRTFQALRIAVNDELRALDSLLREGPERLAAGGRLIVVSYHSLEDRAVKRAFRERARPAGSAYRILTKKPVIAGAEEVDENPRARSAKLRVLERVDET